MNLVKFLEHSWIFQIILIKSFGKTQRQTSEQTSFEFKNAERINFYQPDTSNTKINDKNNSREVFEKLKQQLYLNNHEKLENVGMRQNPEKTLSTYW